MTAPDIVRADALGDVPHAFLGRAGGVSTGIFASLNVGLGSSDDPAAVRENRRRALGALGSADSLVTVRQVHGSRVVAVGCPVADAARPEADAIVTRTRGLALGILTADCAPVLLADESARVVGAAHAGWKGAVAGVIESVVACMEELGADRARIVAAIGPAIAQPSYEVGSDVARWVPHRHLTAQDDGRFRFDLTGFVAQRLRDAGVGTVDRLALDTYAHEARWFSYRRATHRGERDYGRQLSLICLPRPGFAQEPGA